MVNIKLVIRNLAAYRIDHAWPEDKIRSADLPQYLEQTQNFHRMAMLVVVSRLIMDHHDRKKYFAVH